MAINAFPIFLFPMSFYNNLLPLIYSLVHSQIWGYFSQVDHYRVWISWYCIFNIFFEHSVFSCLVKNKSWIVVRGDLEKNLKRLNTLNKPSLKAITFGCIIHPWTWYSSMMNYWMYMHINSLATFWTWNNTSNALYFLMECNYYTVNAYPNSSKFKIHLGEN